jgi:hypothetical protein|tara:strand:+ start:23063 stop:23440 length:378 start_codon:yes stop_codon:yes gene_type:complete
MAHSRYVWWTERDSIGIAKYDAINATFASPDQDDLTATIYYYKRADRISEPSASDAWATEENEILPQFHEHLVEKAIQYGYERNPDGGSLAQYFGSKYEAGIKRARKFAYRARAGTFKYIKPVDF